MANRSIDKLYDKQQPGDRIVFETEFGLSEQIITAVEGNIVRSRYNDDGIGELVRGIQRALDEDNSPDSDPFERIETIEEFRERILASLGVIRTAILVPRESENYEMDPGIIDELYDNPVTGDRIVFSMLAGGELRYERNIIRDVDTIRFEESDNRYTIEQFRSMVLEKLCNGCLMAISLVNRGKAKRDTTKHE